MSETENSKPEDNGQPETEDTAATPQAGAEDTAGETGADASPDDAIVKLTAELDSMRDKLLRALAEAENTRRRAERDVADARSYAVSSFAKDMLDVSDNLSRAVGAVDPATLDDGGLFEALDTLPDKFAIQEYGLEKIRNACKKARIKAGGDLEQCTARLMKIQGLKPELYLDPAFGLIPTRNNRRNARWN